MAQQSVAAEKPFPSHALSIVVSGRLADIQHALESLYNEYAFMNLRGDFTAQLEWRDNAHRAALQSLPGLHLSGASPSNRNWHNDVAMYQERDGQCALELIPTGLTDIDWIIATAYALRLSPYLSVQPSTAAREAAIERIQSGRL